MMARRFVRASALAAAIAMASAQAAWADACVADVSSAMDKQRESYIAQQGSLADQNFSRRPGSFASTTCLGDLMKGGGLDIFFKPPSLDSIIDMVKNLACEQASQIFSQLLGGSGLNGGGALNPGELLKGLNLGNYGGSSLPGLRVTRGGGNVGGSIMELFK